MYTAEVKEGHIEMHGGFKIGQTLAESQAQARKAPQMRSHAKIGAFDMQPPQSRAMVESAHGGPSALCQERES